MSSPDFNLQIAVKALIDAGITGASLSVPCLDEVPQDQAAPYIRIGESTLAEWDTDDSVGHEATLTVHTWSEYAGMKEVKDIMAVIKDSLHDQPITVTGQLVVLALFEFSEVFLDSDGKTRHGVQRFRLLMENT